MAKIRKKSEKETKRWESGWPLKYFAKTRKKVEKETKRRESDRPLKYFPGPFPVIYTALLLAGLAAAAAVYAVLVYFVPGMNSNRSDTMKTALLVIGGSGALAALYVSYRKQRTDEANYTRDQDKLFTERYTQASAQLGSDKAAVRLAGVYAMARIADDSERDRPTCLNVLCAYLRMPYDPRDPKAEPAERQVRTTAQSALAARLQPDYRERFWANADVDLNGSCLLNANFDDIEVSRFNARGAIFIGDTSFKHATFSGSSDFAWAKFRGSVVFDTAVFDGDAVFHGAKFRDAAKFFDVTFERSATFRQARFRGPTSFGPAKFNSTGHCMWDEYADFTEARFWNRASFGSVTFNVPALFTGARFWYVNFSSWFNHRADFSNARFRREKSTFRDSIFSVTPDFNGARIPLDLEPEWPNRFATPEGIAWQSPRRPVGLFPVGWTGPAPSADPPGSSPEE